MVVNCTSHFFGLSLQNFSANINGLNRHLKYYHAVLNQCVILHITFVLSMYINLFELFIVAVLAKSKIYYKLYNISSSPPSVGFSTFVYSDFTILSLVFQYITFQKAYTSQPTLIFIIHGMIYTHNSFIFLYILLLFLLVLLYLIVV